MLDLLLATLILTHQELDERKIGMSAAVAECTSAPPATIALGDQIDAIYDLKQKKKALEDAATDVQRLIDAKETILQADMELQKTSRGAGRRASASISESVVPQVTDWEAFYTFVRRHNAFELLERRPAVAAWREHAERRRDHTVPGTVPFTKRKVNIRVSP